MSKKNGNDGRSNNQPPKAGQFQPGQSGNPLGRPRKKKTTFEDEIKAIFGAEREVTINGKTETRSMRQLILEQIARGAAQGDTKMIKLATPFMKVMDDAPEFEVLPEDRKALALFMNQFNGEGDIEDE
jgi:hypothetical protein